MATLRNRKPRHTLALFRFSFFYFDNIVFLFLFDKYSPIIEYLGLKDLSHDLQINCAINFYFYLNLMFHAFAAKFNTMRNLKKN